MVFDKHSLKVLHGLTPEGEVLYRKMLEDEGTRLLMKAKRPIRHFFTYVVPLLDLPDNSQIS